MQVVIMTPKETLFNGPAIAVSSANSSGNFDILAFHANFITIVDDKPIKVLTLDKQIIEFKFHQAIIYAFQNKVTVYAEPKKLD